MHAQKQNPDSTRPATVRILKVLGTVQGPLEQEADCQSAICTALLMSRY